MEESLVTAPPRPNLGPFPMPHLGGFPSSREGAQDLSHRGRGWLGLQPSSQHSHWLKRKHSPASPLCKAAGRKGGGEAQLIRPQAAGGPRWPGVSVLSRAAPAQKQALSGSQLLGCAAVHVAVYQRGCVFSLLSSSPEYSGTVRGKTSPVLVPFALAGGWFRPEEMYTHTHSGPGQAAGGAPGASARHRRLVLSPSARPSLPSPQIVGQGRRPRLRPEANSSSPPLCVGAKRTASLHLALQSDRAGAMTASYSQSKLGLEPVHTAKNRRNWDSNPGSFDLGSPLFKRHLPDRHGALGRGLVWAGLAAHTACAQHPPALSPCSLKKDLGPGQGTASLAEIRFWNPWPPQTQHTSTQLRPPANKATWTRSRCPPPTGAPFSTPTEGQPGKARRAGNRAPACRGSCRFLKAKTPSQTSVLKNSGRLCPSSCRPWTLS